MSDVRALKRHLALLEGFPVEFRDGEGHWIPDEVPAPPEAFVDHPSPGSMTVGQWEDEFRARHGDALRPFVLVLDAPAHKRRKLSGIRRRDPYLWERAVADAPYRMRTDPGVLLIGDRARFGRDGSASEPTIRVDVPWSAPTSNVLIDELLVDEQLLTLAAAELTIESGWLRVTDQRGSFVSDTPVTRVSILVQGHEQIGIWVSLHRLRLAKPEA